ncbi:hypothetical protein [Mitsuaria sp. GD03876]|uniref:hypothetical protein n=1 Tax=Mitsuaria sp. GD03876 TaxID=2975399 RepID=UPI00244A62F5|nr:hypothetical protein [Mitsuaria sp. GD03876]MDH0863920.1 hypothetical protein [Mitsuaria sp. GD03876]
MLRSDLFQIDPREDEQTNPFCYGRSLAEWIRERFVDLGYQPEPVIPEDWGWCVMLRREPFMLWIACGNDRSAFYDKVTPEAMNSFVPDGREVIWSCFVGTDAPIWTSFFWRRLLGRASTEEQVSLASDQLRIILSKEPRVQVLEDQ